MAPTRSTGAEGIWRNRFGIVVSNRPLNSMASGASKGSLLEHHQKRVTNSEQETVTITGQSDRRGGSKKIPFLNTIKYILMSKEGINRGSWFRLKHTVLTDARNLRRIADVPPEQGIARQKRQPLLRSLVSDC